MHTEVINRDGALVAGTEVNEDRTTDGHGETMLAIQTTFRSNRSTGVYETGVRAQATFVWGGATRADTTDYFPADTIPDYDVIVPLAIQLP
jgi:hypothetical protein